MKKTNFVDRFVRLWFNNFCRPLSYKTVGLVAESIERLFQEILFNTVMICNLNDCGYSLFFTK